MPAITASAASCPIASANPALFAVIVNQDGSLNSESNPAPRGTLVSLFGSGEGLNDRMNVSGMPAQAPYPRPILPVGLTVAGIAAELVYAGSAPGEVGELQVNARIPGGFVPPGPVAGALTVGPSAAPAV